jgi:hypothetical protein
VHPFFFYNHFVVERWREAALWVWAVAKAPERGIDWKDVAWAQIGGASHETTLQVYSNKRRTLDDAYLRDVLGNEEIGSSIYRFCECLCHIERDGPHKLQRAWTGILTRPSLTRFH